MKDIFLCRFDLFKAMVLNFWSAWWTACFGLNAVFNKLPTLYFLSLAPFSSFGIWSSTYNPLRIYQDLFRSVYQLFLCVYINYTLLITISKYSTEENQKSAIFIWCRHINSALISCFERNISAYKTGWEGTRLPKNTGGQTKRPAELGINRK